MLMSFCIGSVGRKCHSSLLKSDGSAVCCITAVSAVLPREWDWNSP